MTVRPPDRAAAAAATVPVPDPAEDARVTPMMRQYLEIKAANPDCLLFYRMGDFYEMFFSDAEVASRALGITLTQRGKHLGQDIPMCGVPVHAADDYLQRLIALGHRVAVCEQTEDPAAARRRGSKAVVRRDVVRLVTPGTLTEDTLLDSRRNNYLAAAARVRGMGDDVVALAWADISTGDFAVAETQASELAAALARIEPGELLVSDSLYDDPQFRPLWRTAGWTVTPLPAASFDSISAERRLRDYFGVATLDGFGALSRAELAAAGAVVAYVDRTQMGSRPPLSPPAREPRGAVMAIDAATRANLELVATLSGERRGSLLAAVDRTLTAPGGRELARRLAAPLTDPAAISARHDAVEWLVGRSEVRRAIRETLRTAPDIARARARIAVGRAGPRDLAAIRDGIAAARSAAATLGAAGDAPAAIAAIIDRLTGPDASLHGRLEAALVDRPPLLRRDGGFVRPGFSADLDEARALRDESRKVVAGLQAKYQEATGIRTLKVRHNNVLGYFVETTAQHMEKMSAEPLAGVFFHRQTLASQVRYSTAELADLEGRIATAAERALALEGEIFDALAAAVLAEGTALEAAAAALGELDVHAGFAELAVERDYVRPLVEASLAFEITGGRHPVVEQALAADAAGPFVANDCDLSPPDGDDGRILLLTGPNMAGKSTFLRQNALIAILAQAGAFVPAARARIGIVDRLFSRVGAADDLARGRSTFMVEMVETAAILNQAGPRALVILDEIGRGTATFDGLSIAWATVEHLHEVNRCRALFATHFHELTALAETLPRLSNATVKVKEWKGEVIFLHEVAPGAADRSYGIQVARLAGLPAAVVARAREVLERLEETDRRAGTAGLVDDLPLFSLKPRRAAPSPPVHSVLAERLAALIPDDLTPRQALDLIYELKALAQDMAEQ
jgi:DNA mismatch repair protein MutS